MEEIWKAIPGYEGRYEASNEGRVRSLDHYSREFINNGTPCRQLRRGKILKGSPDFNGYLNVDLYDDSGRPRTYRVSRLIALTFIPNPNNYSQVDHLNCVVNDNRVLNLEWVSCQENIHRIYERGRGLFVGRTGVVFRCIEDDITFISAKAAADYYNVHPNRIYSCLSGSNEAVYLIDGRVIHFEKAVLDMDCSLKLVDSNIKKEE